jgi:cytochrome c-type biogenesis protein CcmH/NrfF
VDKLESVLILVALVSLWPLLTRYGALWWYRVWLVVVLGLMVWVARRRIARTHAAVEEAKRKREEAQRGRRPPFLQ